MIDRGRRGGTRRSACGSGASAGRRVRIPLGLTRRREQHWSRAMVLGPAHRHQRGFAVPVQFSRPFGVHVLPPTGTSSRRGSRPLRPRRPLRSIERGSTSATQPVGRPRHPIGSPLPDFALSAISAIGAVQLPNPARAYRTMGERAQHAAPRPALYRTDCQGALRDLGDWRTSRTQKRADGSRYSRPATSPRRIVCSHNRVTRRCESSLLHRVRQPCASIG